MGSNHSGHNCVGNPHWFKRHSSLANPVPSSNPQPQVTRVQGLWKSKIGGYKELQKGRLLGPEEVQGSDPQYILCIAAISVFCSWGILLLFELVAHRQCV